MCAVFRRARGEKRSTFRDSQDARNFRESESASLLVSLLFGAFYIIFFCFPSWYSNFQDPTIMERQSEHPLLWLDCEMTGLDPVKDRILEVSCILTDGALKRMQEGPCMVLHCPKEELDAMGAWCREQHGNSGLTEACMNATLTAQDAEREIISFLKQNHVGEKEAVLAGNSIHMDKEFLRKEMPAL